MFLSLFLLLLLIFFRVEHHFWRIASNFPRVGSRIRMRVPARASEIEWKKANIFERVVKIDKNVHTKYAHQNENKNEKNSRLQRAQAT